MDNRRRGRSDSSTNTASTWPQRRLGSLSTLPGRRCAANSCGPLNTTTATTIRCTLGVISGDTSPETARFVCSRCLRQYSVPETIFHMSNKFLLTWHNYDTVLDSSCDQHFLLSKIVCRAELKRYLLTYLLTYFYIAPVYNNSPLRPWGWGHRIFGSSEKTRTVGLSGGKRISATCLAILTPYRSLRARRTDKRPHREREDI